MDNVLKREWVADLDRLSCCNSKEGVTVFFNKKGHGHAEIVFEVLAINFIYSSNIGNISKEMIKEAENAFLDAYNKKITHKTDYELMLEEIDLLNENLM
jgi:hypothetical protein